MGFAKSEAEWEARAAAYLKAELIDSARIQSPRRAKSFGLWIKIPGARLTVPAKKHKALNRALAHPGAQRLARRCRTLHQPQGLCDVL